MRQEFEFSERLMLETEQYMNQLGIPLVEKHRGACDHIKLERYTSMLKVSGALEGYFVLSVDEDLAFTLVKQFLIEKPSDNEMLSFADKVVAEIVNTIVGHALMDREETDVIMHVPHVYRDSEITLNLHSEPQYIHRVITNMGALQCAYIRSDEIWLGF